MARLSQRAVDYSIKAYQLGRPELCRSICDTRLEMRKLLRSVTDMGREILVRPLLDHSDSRFACCALQISRALNVSYTAAIEVAQITMHHGETRGASKSVKLGEIGQCVNSLVRLSTVALFKRDIQLAKKVLQSYECGPLHDITACLALNDRAEQTTAIARFENAIARCLRQIAEQAHEISEAITFWIEGEDCIDVTCDRVAYVPGELQSTRKDHGSESMTFRSRTHLTFPAADFTHKTGGLVTAVQSSEPSNSTTLRTFTDLQWENPADLFEEECQARLASLQERICELLVKNQQLRMEIMAARANGMEDQKSDNALNLCSI